MYHYGYVYTSQYGIKWKCKSWPGHLKQQSLFSVGFFLPQPISPTDQQGILAFRHHRGPATLLPPAELARRLHRALCSECACGGAAFISIMINDS